MSEPAQERLSVDEAAAQLGASRRTVARWCASGLLPEVHKVGARRRGVWVSPPSTLRDFQPSKRGAKPRACPRC